MNRVALTRWLVSHTRRLLPTLVLAVLARIAGQLLGVALFVVAALALARVAAGEAVSTPALLAWLAGIALTKALLRYGEHYAGHWVAFTALQRLRELFFDRLVPQAPAATTGRAGAELTARGTADIDRIEVFFAHTLPPAVAAVLVPALSLIWLAIAVDAAMAAAIAVFLAAVVLLLPLVATGAIWRGARRIAAARGVLATHVGDDAQGAREVLAFGAESVRLSSLDRAERDLGAVRVREGGIQALRTTLGALLHSGAIIAPLAVGLSTGATPLELAVALAVAIGLVGPARGIDDFATGLDAAYAATERIQTIIDAEPAVRDAGAETPAPGAEIALDGVTLRYPGAQAPALDAVTARFAPGEWNYVVGVSGSGKSTLATLLLRGRDADAGAVTLGGTDVGALGLGALRRHIALVSQRPTLLSGTLAENLRLSAPGAGDELLTVALRVAALEDWAGRLDTPIGERGLTVSGGQLQRLALARALVAAPAVLVLDEALSQLDADTATTVRERLAAHDAALTVIEITHRVDLIPEGAPVVVIDAGRVVEAGPAGMLREASGPFARLELRV